MVVKNDLFFEFEVVIKWVRCCDILLHTTTAHLVILFKLRQVLVRLLQLHLFEFGHLFLFELNIILKVKTMSVYGGFANR